jgi:hypothetical protein
LAAGLRKGANPVAATNRKSVRRNKVAMASACRYQDEFHLAHLYLRRAIAF